MKTKCENCGYKWEYKGELEHATCPNCNRKTRVAEGNELER